MPQSWSSVVGSEKEQITNKAKLREMNMEWKSIMGSKNETMRTDITEHNADNLGVVADKTHNTTKITLLN